MNLLLSVQESERGERKEFLKKVNRRCPDGRQEGYETCEQSQASPEIIQTKALNRVKPYEGNKGRTLQFTGI